MAKRSYKVWIEVEEFVDGDPQGDSRPVLPDSLGLFEGRRALKDAMAKVAEVVTQHGIDPENSDSVRATSRCLTSARNRGNLPATNRKGRS